MLKIGSVIDGKYKILNIVGKGGMSIVYLAMNEKVNKQWAIKEILKKDYRDLAMDRKEIEMMKRLKNPHLPAIVDVIEKNDRILIVMDYIEGCSLEDIVQEYGPQDPQKVLCWAKQLCDVLQYLHTRTPPIVYRDMKPSNVMLKPDGNIMLIDFGAAREYKPQNQKDTVLLGTKGYAAPEQYRFDGQSDARTDIYSLGITIFRLLTGENPESLCPIRKLRPEISPGLEKILLKCTKTPKTERYQSAAALLEALNRYWEYDEQFQKEQKRKFLRFLIPCAVTVLFGTASLLFLLKENQVRKNHYHSFLISAENASDSREAIENYEQAIRLAPKEEEPYLLLLKRVFLEDEIFSKEESLELRRILNAYDENGIPYERHFAENEEGYADFCYETGICCFYKYEDKSDKKHAGKYFARAAASKTLEEKKRKRAERLLVISNYYDRIGRMDEAGDVLVTYGDYWEDLTAASEGNLVQEDNERTALVMYETLVEQILCKTAEFQKAGVGKEEMLLQLDHLKDHLKNDFKESEEMVQELLKEEIETLWKNIRKAEKIIASVYGRTT